MCDTTPVGGRWSGVGGRQIRRAGLPELERHCHVAQLLHSQVAPCHLLRPPRPDQIKGRLSEEDLSALARLQHPRELVERRLGHISLVLPCGRALCSVMRMSSGATASGHGSASSARCSASPLWSAATASANTQMKLSPAVCNTWPP